MKIIEQTKDRLVFKIGVPYFNGTSCEFDRAKGRAVLKRVMLFWPLRTIDLPIEEIAAARLASAFGLSGDTTTDTYSKDYPVIELKSGTRISLAAASEKVSKKAVEMINDFLNGSAQASLSA